MANTPDRRRRLRVGLFATIVSLLVVAIALLCLDLARDHIPEFYRRAAPDASADLVELDDQCTRTILTLAGDFEHRGPWEATFSAAQVNAWLLIELQRRFPDVLPAGYSDPRIAIDSHRGRIGIVAGEATPRIYSIEFDLFRASESAIGVRIHRVRIGAIPLPLGAVVEEISAAASRSDVPLTWRQAQGDPVAIVALPQEDRYLIQLDTVELRPGEIYLSGHTRAVATRTSPQRDSPRR